MNQNKRVCNCLFYAFADSLFAVLRLWHNRIVAFAKREREREKIKKQGKSVCSVNNTYAVENCLRVEQRRHVCRPALQLILHLEVGNS